MATNYDFRILIETVSGSQYSYGTGSFVSLDDTSVVITTSQSAARIDNMPEIDYFNGKTFTTSSAALYTSKDNPTLSPLGGVRTFDNTKIDGNSVDYQFVSCSIAGNNESGSLKFSIPEALSADGDHTKRYKFFGNKVCSVLGLPENYWIYSDAFRLSNTASEVNYLSGDLLAQSVNIKDNFAISNAGSIETDLPFKHAKDSDRWLKWTDVSSSLPTNDMLIGYSNLSDDYMIRMQNNNDLIISASSISASGDFKSDGDMFIKNVNPTLNLKQTNGTGVEGYLAMTSGKLLLYNQYDNAAGDLELRTKSFDNAIYIDNSAQKIGIGTTAPSAKLEVNGDLKVTDLKVTHITASGDISSSGKLFLSDGAMSSNSTTDFITLTGYNGDVTATPQAMAIKFLSSDTNSSVTASIRMAVVNDTDYGDNDEQASNLIFATTNAPQGTITDKMIITGRGDVGIGNIAPPSELTVQGDISSSGTIYVGPQVLGQSTFLDENSLTIGNTGDSLNLFAGISGVDSNQPFVTSNGSITMIIDANGSSGGNFFNIKHNSGSPGTATELFKFEDNGKLTVGGQISCSGAITIDSISTSAYSVDAGLKWQMFTGVTGAENTTTAISHGITNGKKRIVGIQFNVVSDENNNGDMVAGDMIVAGSGYSSDPDERPHISFDDSSIHIYISSDGDAIHDSRFTMLVHYANADLY